MRKKIEVLILSLGEEALKNAVEEAKKNSKERNFTESIDLTVVLKGVDMRKTTNRLSQILELPYKLNKKVEICVVAKGDLALRAKKAGGFTLDPDEISSLASNPRKAKEFVKKFNFFIVQSNFMPTIGKYLGRFLGPRGKTPIPFPPTGDIEKRIESLRKSVNLSLKKQPVLHVPVGTKNMKTEEIVKNIKAVLSLLSTKFDLKHNLRTVLVKTTMGKPVKIYP